MFEEVEVYNLLEDFFLNCLAGLLAYNLLFTDVAVTGLRMIMLCKMGFNDECRNVGRISVSEKGEGNEFRLIAAYTQQWN